MLDTRSILIKLRTQGSSGFQHVYFYPVLTGGDGEVLLEKVFCAVTMSNGEATIDLPVGATYRCVLPATEGTSEFEFVLTAGDEIGLDELLIAGLSDTPQPVYDYIDERLEEINNGAAGPASGVLSGNYPSPGFAVNMATQAELDNAVAGLEEAIDGKAATSHTHTAANITDLAATIAANTAVAANTAARHSHTNKSLLDSLVSNGDGESFLNNAGNYVPITVNPIVLNLREFGALSNGVADDTVALQLAMDAAKSAAGHKIFFPEGKTLTDGGSILSPLSSQQGSYIFCGAGSASIWQPTYYADSCMNFGNLSSLTFRDMAIVGRDQGDGLGSTSGNETASAIIYVSTVLHTTYENVLFLGLATSVNADNYGLIAATNTYLKFKNCIFGACSAPNSAVVNGHGLQGFLMEDCWFPDYHELGGVYYNKLSLYGDAKHWVRIHVPADQNNSIYMPVMAKIVNTRFDENTGDSLIKIAGNSGSNQYSAVLENVGFNGGYNQRPCMKFSNLQNLRLQDVYVGYVAQTTPYDSTIITDVDFVRIDNMKHDPPNGAENIQLLGTVNKLVHSNMSGIGITNTAGAEIVELF